MAKLTKIIKDGVTIAYQFRCPGCGTQHRLNVFDDVLNRGPLWNFNGDVDSPTFTPSLMVRWETVRKQPKICHSYITDGVIKFLDDSTHPYAGQSLPLPDITDPVYYVDRDE